MGDIVEVLGPESQFEEVSSIGSDGRIHFKGGGGAGAWPDKIVVRCKRGDDTATPLPLRRRAVNRAALRSRSSGFSGEKHRDLQEFEITAPLTFEDVEQLRGIIEEASDEAPIQRFLESHPQTLGALLGGRRQFCLPRRSFGGKYVPDFLVSDVDSLGVRWVLVELETPLSTITLKDTDDLEQHARRGVSQISEWREWLQNNLDTARRSKRHDGLGLVDIRPLSEGLVLVGRRARLFDNTHMVRNPINEQRRIRVHTYDWLLERLDGLLRHSGRTRANPYVIPPLRDEETEESG